MPVYTREKIPQLLKETIDKPAQVYLLLGDRFLCRQTAQQLEAQLLKGGGTAHPIDGEKEDISNLAGKLRSYSLLPGRQIYQVTDTRIFHSKNVAETIWKRALKAHESKKTEQAAKALSSLLLTAQIQPDSEDSELTELSDTEWQHLFGFSRPKQNIDWTREALASIRDTQQPKQQPAYSAEDLFLSILQEPLPAANVLILQAEEVDKRKKLFKYFKEHHVVIDLMVESGASSRAKKNQTEVLLSLAQQTLKKYNKSASPQVINRLLDRVGFYPVALVMELEKVILYVDERQQISIEDIDTMVGRTRQEALFELTTALTDRNLNKSISIATRLQENGIHPLAMIATLRNTFRSLLLFRALQDQQKYRYTPSMNAQLFQSQCLPLLKGSPWTKELSGHPYAVFMQFTTASRFTLKELQTWMRLLLKTEIRLKSSAATAEIVLLDLFTSMLCPAQ